MIPEGVEHLMNSSDDDSQKNTSEKSVQNIDDIQIDPKQIEIEEAKFIED